MAVPAIQQLRIGAYIIGKKLRGVDKYPLVLMLEPLFRCNLACPGCGKIDYDEPILNKRMSVKECIAAVEECGAPVVTIPGGEPLLHRDIHTIVAEITRRKKFVYLCTNGLLLEKKLELFQPSDYLTFTVHLDGLEGHHDRAVNQPGTFTRAVAAIRAAKAKGFRVNVNCTFFNTMQADEAVAFFNFCTDELKVDGITASPGYAYERAPQQSHFLNRTRTKQLFRDILKKQGRSKWRFTQSVLFLDFLTGNQTYKCTPWGTPTRNIFGWQRPCYLLGEGYVKTFRELMEQTDWDRYGTGNYEKCADCMVHCGYEGTAVDDTFRRPWKALQVKLFGHRTDGPMAPEIPLANQRPAEFVFESLVKKLAVEVVPEVKASSGERKQRSRVESTVA